VPVACALLAADAASPGGFHPQDVRFFFHLFTNWMGDDHLRPGADLDPTQIRRTLTLLADQGEAEGGGGRPPSWALTPAGVIALVDTLTDPGAPRRLEEVALLVGVASWYAPIIAARAGGRSGERRVRTRLEPRRILQEERRRLAGALADMERRAEVGPRLADAAREALARGEDPAAALARLGLPYQLHPMRPIAEVLAALPPDLRRFELERGLRLRARSLFAPLADHLRAQIEVLDRLAATLEGG